MTTNKSSINTPEMVKIITNALSYVCGHDRDLDDAQLLELEAAIAQDLKSIRASLRYRENGCTAIYPKDME